MSDFHFIIGAGLYYGGDFISNFSPEVVEVILQINMDNNETDKTYVVRLLLSEGAQTEPKPLKSLNDVSYFELWRCPDANLNTNQKALLTYKMQEESKNIKPVYRLICGQGLYFYGDKPLYVFGDTVVRPDDMDAEVVFRNSYKLYIVDQAIKMNLKNYIREYLNFMPGVSEPLFYYSLTAVLKPLYWQLGEKMDFCLALIGPSGHLKTSMVEAYSLWLKNLQQQESAFSESAKVDQIFQAMDRLAGLNYLMDDLHPVKNYNSRTRQENYLDRIVRHSGKIFKCANLLITGESMEKMGIFSCMDRIFPVYIEGMDDELLCEFKKKFAALPRHVMPFVAYMFVQALMNDFERTLDLMAEALHNCENSASFELDFSTRVPRNIAFIKATQLVFKDLLCGGDAELSCEEELDRALEKNALRHQKELNILRKQEQPAVDDTDYVEDVYKMLTGKYLYCESNYQKYLPGTNCFLMDKDKIYIYPDALEYGMNRYYQFQRVVNLLTIKKALNSAGLLFSEKDSLTKKFKNHRHVVISLSGMELYCHIKHES